MTYEPVLLGGLRDPQYRRIESYLAAGGYETARRKLRELSPEQVVGLVKESGLRGRGGAGFPTGMKWTFLPKEGGQPVYLAVNADESEPGTFKDRFLLERNPHLMLEGIILTAHAIKSRHAYVYLRGEFVFAFKVVQQAVNEAYGRGFLGRRVFGTDLDLDVTVVRGAGAYICGEETAMLESLEGKRGHPRNKPPFPAVSGLFGSPTIINNVETLCCVPLIVERGVEWFKSLGGDKNWGPKLWCVSGHVKRPGIYETALGVTVAELLEEHCGGVRDGHRWKAAVPGGCSCGIVRADEFGTKLDFDALRAVGSSLGTGGVMAWDETTCVPAALASFAEFFAEESCGQCTPCRQGCAWTSQILHRVMAGRGLPGDIEEIRRLATAFTGTTICALADAAAIPIQSYIAKFPEEFAHHLRTGSCDVTAAAVAAAAGVR